MLYESPRVNRKLKGDYLLKCEGVNDPDTIRLPMQGSSVGVRLVAFSEAKSPSTQPPTMDTILGHKWILITPYPLTIWRLKLSLNHILSLNVHP